MEATGKKVVKRICINTVGLKFRCIIKYICSKYLLHILSLKDKPVRTIKCQSPDAKHFKKIKKNILVLCPLSFGDRKIYKLRFCQCVAGQPIQQTRKSITSKPGALQPLTVKIAGFAWKY
jgi:hypothetical protein